MQNHVLDIMKNLLACPSGECKGKAARAAIEWLNLEWICENLLDYKARRWSSSDCYTRVRVLEFIANLAAFGESPPDLCMSGGLHKTYACLEAYGGCNLKRSACWKLEATSHFQRSSCILSCLIQMTVIEMEWCHMLLLSLISLAFVYALEAQDAIVFHQSASLCFL